MYRCLSDRAYLFLLSNPHFPCWKHPVYLGFKEGDDGADEAMVNRKVPHKNVVFQKKVPRKSVKIQQKVPHKSVKIQQKVPHKSVKHFGISLIFSTFAANTFCAWKDS